MNWVDYVILGVVGLSVLVSIFRGLLREVLALATWAAAFWVAFAFSPRVTPMLPAQLTLPSARVAIAFVTVFLLVLLVGALVGYLVGKLIESTGLSATDRLLGSLFGAARGVLIVTIAVMLAGFTPFSDDPWWGESSLLPPFESMAMMLRRKLPAIMPAVADLPNLDKVTAPTTDAKD